MLQSLHALIRIQGIDEELGTLAADLAQLPERRSAIDGDIASAREAVVAAGELLETREREERQLERQMREQEALKERLNAQTGQITSSHAYKALQHEIEHAESASSSLETQALELMEAIDKARCQCSTAERELSDLEEQATARIEGLAEQEQQLNAQCGALHERREKESQQLQPGLLEHYERVARKHQPAVAIHQGDACPVCRIVLPPQLLHEIQRADAVHTCTHCHRLLVPARVLEDG